MTPSWNLTRTDERAAGDASLVAWRLRAAFFATGRPNISRRTAGSCAAAAAFAFAASETAARGGGGLAGVASGGEA